eukprot:Nk52_evm2s300 gene=Nk52_evmTU2s300
MKIALFLLFLGLLAVGAFGDFTSKAYNAPANCETFDGIRCTKCKSGYNLGLYDAVCYLGKCPDGQIAAAGVCAACLGTFSNTQFVCKVCTAAGVKDKCTEPAFGFTLADVDATTGETTNTGTTYGTAGTVTKAAGLAGGKAIGNPCACMGTIAGQYVCKTCSTCVVKDKCTAAADGFTLADIDATTGETTNAGSTFGTAGTVTKAAGLAGGKSIGNPCACMGTIDGKYVCKTCSTCVVKDKCTAAADGYTLADVDATTGETTNAGSTFGTAGTVTKAAGLAGGKSVGNPSACYGTTASKFECKACSTSVVKGHCDTAGDGYWVDKLKMSHQLPLYGCKTGTGGASSTCSACTFGTLYSATNIGGSQYQKCLCTGTGSSNVGESDVSGVCTACGTGCAECKSSSVGVSPFSAYYIKSDNTCDSCASGCVRCTSGTACTEPASGKYGTTTMSDCITGCATCTDGTAGTCSKAKDGYFLTKNSAGAVTAVTGCQSTTLCRTCTSATVCTAPASGAFLRQGVAIACAKNCAACTWSSAQSSTCSKCSPGFVMYNGGCVSSCPAGYGPDSTGSCSACYGTSSITQYVCKVCSTPGVASKCLTVADGYVKVSAAPATSGAFGALGVVAASNAGLTDTSVEGNPSPCLGTITGQFVCKTCTTSAVKDKCTEPALGFTLADVDATTGETTNTGTTYGTAGTVTKAAGLAGGKAIGNPCACMGTIAGQYVCKTCSTCVVKDKCTAAADGFTLADIDATTGETTNAGSTFGTAGTVTKAAGLAGGKSIGNPCACMGTIDGKYVCKTCSTCVVKDKCTAAADGYTLADVDATTGETTNAGSTFGTAGTVTKAAGLAGGKSVGNPSACEGTDASSGDVVYKCLTCSTSVVANKCTSPEGCSTALVVSNTAGEGTCSQCKGSLVLSGTTHNFCGAAGGSKVALATTGTVESCGQTGCGECTGTSAGSCSTEMDGYYMASANTPAACIAGCSKCTGATNATCTEWKPSFYRKADNTFAQGPKWCAVAVGQYECSQCDVGFSLTVQKGCVANCPFGYFSSGGVCTALGSNCLAGIDASSCTLCKEGYSVFGGGCVACESGCLRCEPTAATATAGSCVQPMDGYYLAATDKKGVAITSPATKGIPTMCAGANCKSCQQEGVATDTSITTAVCMVAMKGYFLATVANGTTATAAGVAGFASPCTDQTGCGSCSAQGAAKCITANAGYYLSSTEGTATACASNTNAGSPVSTATSSGSCTNANSGYRISSGTTAEACSDSNCDTCSADKAICEQCRAGFVMDSASSATCGCTAAGYSAYKATGDSYIGCNACSSNCNACSSATVCTTCDAASKKVTNGSVVSCESTCPSGQLDVSGVCTACTSPCATCSGTVTTCASCISGYTLSGTTCSQNSTSNGTTPNNPTSSCDKTTGTGCTSPQVCLLSGGVFNCVSPIALGADCSTSGSTTSDPVPCVSGAICFASSASSSKCVNASVGSTGTGTTRPTDTNSNIDSTVNLGDNVSFGTAVKIGAGSAISYNVTIGSSVTMGTGVQVATGVQVKDSVTLKDNVVVAQGVILNSGAQVGSGVNIGKGTNVGANVVLGKGTSVAPSCILTAGCALGEGVVLNTVSTVGADSVLGATAKPTSVTKATVTGKISGATLTLGTGNIFQGTYSIGATNTFGNSNTAEPNFTTGDSLTVGNGNIFKNGVEVNGGIILTSEKTFSGTVTSDANGVPNTAVALFTSPYMVSAAIATALYMML